MNELPTLYSAPPSFYSQIARLVLVEKGVPVRLVLVAAGPPTFESYAPWYMGLNPGGTVPTLVVHGDGGERIVADSRDIPTHVDAEFDGPALQPADPERRARVEELVAALYEISTREISYGSAKLAKNGARANAMRCRNLRKRMARHPELRDAYAAKLRDIEDFSANSRDAAKVEAERARLERRLDELERAAGQGEFLTGASYSLADVVWTVAKMLLTKLWPHLLALLVLVGALVWLLVWLLAR